MMLPMNTPIPFVRNKWGTRPGGSHVYIVRWPDGVTKVGWSFYEKRWRGFIAKGATLIALMSSDHYATGPLEVALLETISAVGVPAFKQKMESIAYLGAGGGGYLECFHLTVEHLELFETLVTDVLLQYEKNGAQI